MTSARRDAASLSGLVSGSARPLGALVDAVARLQSPRLPSAPPPTAPETPRDREPGGESSSRAETSEPDFRGGSGVSPDRPPHADSAALPPRLAERRPGRLPGSRSDTKDSWHNAEGAGGHGASVERVPDEPSEAQAGLAPLQAATSVGRAASTADFPGVPDVQIEWHQAPDGQATSYTARVRDEAGRPLAANEVTLLVPIAGEGVREIPLSGPAAPGTYQGLTSNADPDLDNMRVRVVLGGKRFEIPAPRRLPGESK